MDDIPKTKTSFKEAVLRSQQRRGHAIELLNPNTMKKMQIWGKCIWVEKLTNFCDDNAPVSTEGTTAVGRLDSGWVFIASDLPQYHFNNKLEEIAKYFDTIPDKIFLCKKQSGLHKEMAILRAISEQGMGNKKTLFLTGLQIGTTKGCCLDCAGYLNELYIPHTATSGKASSQWIHPFTGSTYMGKKNLESYMNKKTGKSYSPYDK